jgi:hypothetical protein
MPATVQQTLTVMQKQSLVLHGRAGDPRYMTYNFPLGSDHDDRDFARAQQDLRAQPQLRRPKPRSWRRPRPAC